MAADRPLLRKKVYAVFSDSDESGRVSDLEEAGVLFLGGPVTSLDGHASGSLLVVRATSVEEARACVGEKAGRAQPWVINEGRLALDLRFSTSSCEDPDHESGSWTTSEFVFLAETIPARPEIFQANVDAHLAYQFRLEDRGALLAAGPLRTDDDAGFSGSGLVMYRAADVAGAMALAGPIRCTDQVRGPGG